MVAVDDSVLPETEHKIALARGLPADSWRPRDFNLGETLATAVAAAPDKNFLTYYDDNGNASHWTYREFQDSVLKTASLMHSEMHVGPTDRIATLCVNDPRTVFIYFAAWHIGAVVVPVNVAEDDERINYILINSGAKVLFYDASVSGRIGCCVPGISLKTIEIDALGGEFDTQVASTPALDELHAVSPDNECLIVYTSGTTGAPKGVSLEHSCLLADAQSIAEWHHFGAADRAMCVLPIHHVNGTVVTLVTPVYSGGSVVLNRRFHAGRFWNTLAAERCTWTSVVPTVLAFLNERKADISELDLSAFRHIICGAGPLTVELAHRFDAAFGVRVVHGYGLSETTCYSCFLPIDLDQAEYKHWMFDCGFPSIGCPIAVNEMAIHDSAGIAMQPDVRGEIVVRGYNVMRHYFLRPDANRDAFEHGWFRSGDEGFYRRGEDGREYYFITGRLKELIIRGGINYSPFDIDEVLTAIPGVKAAMAVGFENNFYGEEIGAYVQLEQGASLSQDSILEACRKELSYAKSPKVVLFGTEFPVTSTGKYQRSKLKLLFAEWKDAQFRETR